MTMTAAKNASIGGAQSREQRQTLGIAAARHGGPDSRLELLQSRVQFALRCFGEARGVDAAGRALGSLFQQIGDALIGRRETCRVRQLQELLQRPQSRLDIGG